MSQFIQVLYLVATVLFIFSLKWMSNPKTARRAVIAGVAGMAIAVIGTLLYPELIEQEVNRMRGAGTTAAQPV